MLTCRRNYTGEVKITTERKDARIYVDGGFAGRADKLKKFPLQTGNHNLELRDSDGRTFYQERVQVIAGKTTRIHVG
jgi:PEGA domain